jgi:lysophospholipase L1-like esterase
MKERIHLSDTQKKTFKIAFWGDSITQGIPGCSYFEKLQQKLDPNLFLLQNYGKGGDTVVSLYNRIRKHNTDDDYDMIFLLVGVNDVFVRLSSFYPFIKTIAGQPWAKSEQEFKTYYKKNLELMSKKSKTVIAVSPLFIGEDLTSRWNAQLNKQREIISNLTNHFGNITFMNLYDELKSLLLKYQSGKKRISDYLPTSSVKIMLDTLFLNDDTKVAAKSEKRALYFTLDGVHLNHRGAIFISERLKDKIEEIVTNSQLSL